MGRVTMGCYGEDRHFEAGRGKQVRARMPFTANAATRKDRSHPRLTKNRNPGTAGARLQPKQFVEVGAAKMPPNMGEEM